MKKTCNILIWALSVGLLASCATHPARFATKISDTEQYVILDRAGIQDLDIQKDNLIETLSLAENNLDHIPTAIKNCKHLKNLNLEGNRIKHIPSWLLQLDSLEEINLNFNQLQLRRSDIRRLAKVKGILLAGNHINRLPRNVGRLHCENLNLAKNDLHSLPKSFAKLNQMKSLIFYENDFENIPEVLTDFKNLIHLDFYKNRIAEIPDFVGNMENLQQLFISYNKIEMIPDTVRNLKRLKYLYIHHNELHFLPTWIVEMDSIERLSVGYNHLLELPDLSKMKALLEFDCEHNLIERFPWELVEKPEMEILVVRDNSYHLSFQETVQLKNANKSKRIVY